MPDLRRFYRNTSHQLPTAMGRRARHSQETHDHSVIKAHCNELVRIKISHMNVMSVLNFIFFSEWADSARERNMERNHSANMWSSSHSSSQLGVQVRTSIKIASLQNVNKELPFRCLDPTKIITDDKRLRFSFVGITDIVSFDPNQQNPFQLVNHYQQVSKSTPQLVTKF